MGTEQGLVQVGSHYSVDETITRLTSAFGEKGLQVFAVIDHSGEAGESRPEDAADEGGHLWQPQGGELR